MNYVNLFDGFLIFDKCHEHFLSLIRFSIKTNILNKLSDTID